MQLTNRLRTHGKVERRMFLGAFALGSICVSQSLQLTLREQPGPLAATGADAGDDRIRVLDHPAYMRRALLQAKKVPKRPFGAVLVRASDGSVVAEGHNRTTINPTYHGEMDAI